MSNIFLSYKSEDRARAKIIAEALERQGYSVWWDRIIPPGKTFDQVIEEALDASKCVIVLWSTESVKSDWVKNEADEGARRGILIPVLIENVKIPLAYRRIQAANLIAWKGTLPYSEFDLLLESVRKIIGRPLEVKKPPRDGKIKLQPEIASKWELESMIASLIALIFFYWILIPYSCYNPDLLIISIIFGFPLVVILMWKERREKKYRFVWILIPIFTYLIGIPYGHAHGTMGYSPLFHIEVGEYCQEFFSTYSTLAISALPAFIIDYYYIKNKYK